MKQAPPHGVDEYIADFPESIRETLEKIRKTIRTTAPEASEAISYHMPAYKYRGRYLVYFAGYKNHVGFYPVSTGIAEFKEALSNYKTGKGSAQFPYDKPLPVKLISQIVRFRMSENLKKEKLKSGTAK